MPYQSGLPIDDILETKADDTSPVQVCCKEAYQSLIGSIGWLAICTRPDLAPIHSFLSSYNHQPSASHMKAALYDLHHIHSTHDHIITFSSRVSLPIHSFLHQPDCLDIEAYDDVLPHKPSRQHHLTTYSDACWGSYIGNAICASTLLPLFKLRSMSGAVIFRMGGPLAWKGDFQDKTSMSSCEAEICSANECSKLTVGVRNLAE
jgi:hypothetical protein